jgi:hypothetical protein
METRQQKYQNAINFAEKTLSSRRQWIEQAVFEEVKIQIAEIKCLSEGFGKCEDVIQEAAAGLSTPAASTALNVKFALVMPSFGSKVSFVGS